MTGRISDKRVVEELRKLAVKHGGILNPEDVVEAAKSKSSPLHDKFEWDDTEAARQYRIDQARDLLRIVVHFIGPEEDTEPVRVFTSLTPDRSEGGGYRLTVDVLSDADMRAQLLQDALDELDTFQRKYSKIKELSVVFDAVKKVKRQSKKVSA